MPICKVHWNPGGEQSSDPRCVSLVNKDPVRQVDNVCLSYSRAKETEAKWISKQGSQQWATSRRAVNDDVYR